MTSVPGPSARPLRVIERAVYRGPNLYSRTPMIRIRVDLGQLEDWPTDRIEGFTDRLLAQLPSLADHHCSRERPGGFVERLREGTWIGHVIEHVALELQALAGAAVVRGKTRAVKGRPGFYDILFAWREEAAGLAAGRLALGLVESLLPDHLRGLEGLEVLGADIDLPRPFTTDQAVAALRKLSARVGLGPTTAALVAEAQARGIPALRLDDLSLVQLGWGSRQQRIQASITGRTSQVAVETAGDKNLTKLLLEKAGIPTPRGVVVRDVEAAVREARGLTSPLAVKPLDGNHGRGVSTEIGDEAALREAFDFARRHGQEIVVEEHLQGADHRILVIDGEVVAVTERVPAHVIGDGARSIRDLVDEVNADPRRGDGHEAVMTKIALDERCLRYLARSELTLDSVPEAGRKVFLCPTANLSTGGLGIDRTDEIHPANAALARRAAMTIGLDVAGVDFIAPDISQPVIETGGGIVEVNAAPGFRMHLEPAEGKPRPVARHVVRMLFPEGETGRIPIFAVTGTNGKSTTARMMAHILRQTGCTVGLTTTSGVYINDERVLKADAGGPKSARMLLRDPTVDCAVLETARGGLLREGLAFDRCDGAAMTNIAPDHLGLGGVNTVQDLARVKSVVIEAVRDGGVSVLNGDDVLVARMRRRRAGGRVGFFSLRGGDALPEFLRRHIDGGGLAILREPDGGAGEVVIYDEGVRRLLMRASEIPATIGGLAEFNLQNAMTAALMAFGHGIRLRAIKLALGTFGASFEQNPGRLNIFDGHGFRVILDYAHNAASLVALGDLVRKMRPMHRRIIGTATVPGDRRDEDIREMGEVAAMIFDEVVFREDDDLRGRRPGEVVALLAEGAARLNFPDAHIHRVADERAAADACLRMARPGDLVVLTPAYVEEMWRQVMAFTPEHGPTAELPTLSPPGLVEPLGADGGSLAEDTDRRPQLNA